MRHDRRQRNAAELETGERVDAGGYQRYARGGDRPEQLRVGLEHVLVEVLVADDARPQRERAREMRHGIDPVSEIVTIHRVSHRVGTVQAGTLRKGRENRGETGVDG